MSEKALNVALLHYTAPPVVGGVEGVLGHHARLLAGQGHRVHILAGRGARQDPRSEFTSIPLLDSRHPEVMRVKTYLDRGEIPAEFEHLTESLFSALRRAIQGVDFLIAHNVCSLAKNLPLTVALHRLSARLREPHLILWHHDLAWTTPRYQAELHAGYPWDLLRQDWPNATQVVVSQLRQGELANLIGVPAARIHVVPNGLDLASFLQLEAQTQELIAELDLLSGAPILLAPVRITRRKNLELALRVIAALKEYYPQVRLVVTGPPGPHNPANVQYFTELRALRRELRLEDAVHFLAEIRAEYLPDGVIADCYRLADGLLMPSREEGFGIPILEAGLAGLPVFCADIPPLREVGGEQATYFALDEEPAAIAAAIAEVLAAERIFHLRWRVRRDYTWERIYAEHIEPLIR